MAEQRESRPRSRSREEKVDDGMIEKLIAVNRVSKTVKGGRVHLHRADGGGRRQQQDRLRLRQGARSAGRHPEVDGAGPQGMSNVDLNNGTLFHRGEGQPRCGACSCSRRPEGTGVIAGGAMRAVLEAVGVKNVLAKAVVSRNPINLVRATIRGLEAMHSPAKIAAKRGKKVEDLING